MGGDRSRGRGDLDVGGGRSEAVGVGDFTKEDRTQSLRDVEGREEADVRGEVSLGLLERGGRDSGTRRLTDDDALEVGGVKASGVRKAESGLKGIRVGEEGRRLLLGCVFDSESRIGRDARDHEEGSLGEGSQEEGEP